MKELMFLSNQLLLEAEVWKDIPNREGYQASNWGRIRSVDRYIETGMGGGIRFRSGRLLVPKFTRKRYQEVTLACSKINNKRTLVQTVHKLVMWAFGPPKGDNTQINHKNGRKNDNRYVNLEWCKNGYNGKHAYDTGLKILPKGELNANSKLTWEDINYIRKNYIKKYGEREKLAKQFNVTGSNIHDIVNNRTWKVA